MSDEIWIFGGTGRTGRAVAGRLQAAGAEVVLVGRDQARCRRGRLRLDRRTVGNCCPAGDSDRPGSAPPARSSRFRGGPARPVATAAKDRPRPSSWARARLEWPGGRVREGWLRTGDAMDFTVGALSGVALRLAKDEGQPGAYTPGALFGPEMGLAAGGEFVTSS